MTDIIISRFSSLNFQEWKHSFETDECYMQKFASTDIITVQFLSDKFSLPNIVLTDTSIGESQSIVPVAISSGKYQFSIT